MAKKLFLYMTMSLLGIWFPAISHPVFAAARCFDFSKEKVPLHYYYYDDEATVESKKGEKLLEGFDRRLVITALLGREPESIELEDIKMGVLRYPSLPKAYIVWAWNKSFLYIGMLRHSGKETITEDQWIAEPLRQLPLKNPPQVFDCTTYKLGTLHYVFGFRTYESGMYSGGGWREEHLWLFAEHKDKFVNILETLIASSAVLPGYAGHTPDKTFVDGSATLLPIGTKSIPDLEKMATIITKSPRPGKKSTPYKQKRRQLFIWDENKNSYHSTEDEIVPEEGSFR